MMPKISVRPAASRNSSIPSWMPFSACSMKYSMVRHPEVRAKRASKGDGPGASAGILRGPRSARAPQDDGSKFSAASSFHRALRVIRVLVVLDDLRDGVQRIAAVGILLRLFKIEALDRQVVVV